MLRGQKCPEMSASSGRALPPSWGRAKARTLGRLVACDGDLLVAVCSESDCCCGGRRRLLSHGGGRREEFA